MTPWLLVALGAAVGAVGRALAESVQRRDGGGFPYGTFGVNVMGSFVLGLVVAAERQQIVGPEVVLLVGTGFSGALTTFSGFAARIETDLAHRRRRLAIGYAATSLVVGLAAAVAGYTLVIA
jgi:CrcB protein